MNKKRYKTIDLCAGIGGIRRGFELTNRFINVATSEIDKFACLTYKHLFPDDRYEIQNDITSEEFKRGLESLNYDVLLAGFPCQAFSSVGLKHGFEDTTRGTIFFDIAKIIKKTNPKAIFMENVQNLFSHDGGNTFKSIIEILENELDYKIVGVTKSVDGVLSYNLKSFLRNSKNYGVPQNRPRLFIMGFSRKYFDDSIVNIKDKLPESRDGQPIFEDVEAIMEHDVDSHYYMSVSYLETLKRHKTRQKEKGNGFGYCVVNEKEYKPHIANTILATGGSGKERNLLRQYKDGVSGVMIRGKRSELNSEGIRIMTPLEWARLQGFAGYAFMEGKEDKFRFPEQIPESQKYKQLGNSVTIPLIQTLAEYMLECFDIIDK